MTERLSAAQRALEAADRRRDAAKRDWEQSKADYRRAQQERIEALREAIPNETPSEFREAAEILGVSLPRVYQLLRDY